MALQRIYEQLCEKGRAILVAESDEEIGRLLDSYESFFGQLRQILDDGEQQLDSEQLEALRELHEQVLATLRRRRDELDGAVRGQRKSKRVARTYGAGGDTHGGFSEKS